MQRTEELHMGLRKTLSLAKVFFLPRNQISVEVEGVKIVCCHVWGNVSVGGGVGGLMKRLIVVSSSEEGSCGVLPITVGVWL